ncbi:hypothetical protein [Burkholderia cenocepacia]|uniref:hypothetical protein n=1 Tax=Burkholderia cenocepacia TaxID=95486 RepID=UPI001BA252B4|nr:hypothetical protein [Burkholderia cenocepacia]MBR7945389.1 hypothetical protein [Burkholderia cenocepacia]
MTNDTTRDAFHRMNPEARAAIVAAAEQVFSDAKATLAAFVNGADLDDEREPLQPTIDEGYMTDRDFLDRYGYPASWDNEVPQPRSRPMPAAVAETMLRDTAGSSDELDAGLFEGLGDD